MANTLSDQVLTGAQEQIRELLPGLEQQVALAAIVTQVSRLLAVLNGLPADPDVGPVVNGVSGKVANIQQGNAPLSDLGSALVDLYTVQQALQQAIPGWVITQKATATDADLVTQILLDLIRGVRQLLNYRPDVGAIMDDLNAIKHLGGGPADAEAFHDFHVLQMAFKNVWMHAFNANLKQAAASLYEETVKLYDDLGMPAPDVAAIDDIDQLQSFMSEVQSVIDPGAATPAALLAPPNVAQYCSQALAVWTLLSPEQQQAVSDDADAMQSASTDDRATLQAQVLKIIENPQGNASRLSRLIGEIGEYLSEPYAFDIFAPDSYNFGLLITYRQKWTPGPYQAGNLVATIPLAPGEIRKYSKRKVVKTSRAEKEIEKSMSTRSQQSSETSRAEAEIMQKVTTATNFKMTAHGSFSLPIGNIDSTSEFGANQDQQSSSDKKSFHEATVKAAEEYRLERTMEVDTTTSVEQEETVSGEISNPNNEITVTHLFYELQRRYTVKEFLYRVQPVILIAQDVPAPEQINEAWLIEHQWILARVLLDDSLRPALDYLNSGFAGDEASIEIIKAQWEAQATLVNSLQKQVDQLLDTRNWLRDSLVASKLGEDEAKTMEQPTAVKIFTLGLAPDPAQMQADQLEAARQAFETRLQNTEQSLVEARDSLKSASDAFRQSTKEYAAAMKNQYTRHTAIDQLRVHVKQNILYYMQAIWDHEPPDQRFFRLYNKQIICPAPANNCSSNSAPAVIGIASRAGVGTLTVEIANTCAPVFAGLDGDSHDLVEIADIDSPLGYKGNYIIFPLNDPCYLTTYMLTEFIDNYLGVRDPDGSDDFDAEGFDQEWQDAVKSNDQARLTQLKKELTDYVSAVRRDSDEIIVPTGQLFIESLPGSHPLLEDFKLMHRFEDVRKVKAEVRHAELENLRLASRLASADAHVELLEDPDIEKKIIVEGSAGVNVNE